MCLDETWSLEKLRDVAPKKQRLVEPLVTTLLRTGTGLSVLVERRTVKIFLVQLPSSGGLPYNVDTSSLARLLELYFQ